MRTTLTALALAGKLLWGSTYTPGWIMSILGAMVIVWATTRRRRVYW